MDRKNNRIFATAVLLAASAWLSVADAGACLGAGPARRCAPDAAPVSAAKAPAPTAASAPGADVRVAPIHTTPDGQSYGRWAAQWWQWVLGVPATSNPLADTDGSHCAERQVGDVWFLAGALAGAGSVVRTCTVPARKALFFPLINNFMGAFLSDPPEQRTDAFMRAAAACKDPVTIEAWIDDKAINKPTGYFTGAKGSPSPLFNVQLPPGNLFGLDETVVPELVFSPSAEEGYYLFVQELAAGNHRIRWLATGCTEGNVQDITYYLKVQ
ncbi:hypothetical protein [Ramlibacter sp. AN1133]|uniref:hypothetical protein n=1 Tax=Ramlibacter sp. AN1133 TaxID=3133429 RepID=UPI0030BD04B1